MNLKNFVVKWFTFCISNMENFIKKNQQKTSQCFHLEEFVYKSSLVYSFSFPFLNAWIRFDSSLCESTSYKRLRSMTVEQLPNRLQLKLQWLLNFTVFEIVSPQTYSSPILRFLFIHTFFPQDKPSYCMPLFKNKAILQLTFIFLITDPAIVQALFINGRID